MEEVGGGSGAVIPGFRFYPTEEELISFYLHHKLQATLNLDQVIPVVDIYKHEPWELPKVAGGREDDKEVVSEEQWFFFTAQQEREARGGKPNRTTASGYWKATGSPGWVYSTSSSSNRGSSSSSNSNSNVIGAKKTMVFYKGRAPFGSKTPWKMNEYKAVAVLQPNHNISDASSITPKLRHEMSVCRVYITSAGSSRAFDRRPLSNAITTLLPPVLPHHHQQPLESPADHTQERISNTIANNINNEEEDDDDDELMITAGLQPFWEWERFNCP